MSTQDSFNDLDDYPEDHSKNAISDEDLFDIVRVLKKQKQGIDILNDSVNESARQLMVMDREISLHH